MKRFTRGMKAPFRWQGLLAPSLLAPSLLASGLLASGLLTAACSGGASTLPDAGAEYAFPSPIKHVLVLVKENHSFDNLFMNFPNAVSSSKALLSTGVSIDRKRVPAAGLTDDLRHSHQAAVDAYNAGKMDGFDRKGDGAVQPFYYYAEDQVPSYWAYARNYVLCDRFFSNTLANSTPGHFALWAAQAPMVSNPKCPADNPDCGDFGHGCYAEPQATIDTANPDTCEITRNTTYPCFKVPSVVDELPPPLTWRVYSNQDKQGSIDTPAELFYSLTRDRESFLRHVADEHQLAADLLRGDMANITFAHIGGPVSEHPPQNICCGENFTVEVINAAMRGPHWKDTAILLTWDDWGGFYDSVPPPIESCPNGDYLQPGFRVPLLVISPYSRRSRDPQNPFVYSAATEQASVPLLIEDLFRLPRLYLRDLHARDGRVGSLLGAFDFVSPPVLEPLILQQRTCPPAPACAM